MRQQQPELSPTTSKYHQNRFKFLTLCPYMNKLLINTLGKLQWLVDASYTSAVVDAFSSRRKRLRVFKIYQHIYLNLQHFQTDT